MQHDGAGGTAHPAAGRRSRALPAQVVADLRAAYAEEVADRLPRLLQAAAAGSGGADTVRDAHSLGSSSFVVDEPDAGRLAREVEQRLLEGRPFAEQVHALALRLRGWGPR